LKKKCNFDQILFHPESKEEENWNKWSERKKCSVLIRERESMKKWEKEREK
jgi:hypothetical protein